jgi:transposase-like protein
MTHPLSAILSALASMSTEKSSSPTFCLWCNRNRFIKHGKYYRYALQGQERCPIQRYLCKSPGCMRTFSILPHAFLRYLRFSLCVLCELLAELTRNTTKTQISRILGVSYTTVLRISRVAGQIFHWINHETDAPWRPSPCVHGPRAWTTFIKMFSWKFYPIRYAHLPPTQFVYCV